MINTNTLRWILGSILIGISIGEKQLYSMQHEFTTPILHLRQLLEAKNDKQYKDSLNQLVQLLKLQNLQVKSVSAVIKATEQGQEIDKQVASFNAMGSDNSQSGKIVNKVMFHSPISIVLALRFIQFLVVTRTDIIIPPNFYLPDQNLAQELEPLLNNPYIDNDARLFAQSLLNIHKVNEAMNLLSRAQEEFIDVLSRALKLYMSDRLCTVNIDQLKPYEKLKLIETNNIYQVPLFKNKFIKQCASQGYAIAKDCFKYIKVLANAIEQGCIAEKSAIYDRKYYINLLKNACQNYFNNEQPRFDTIYAQACAELEKVESNVSDNNSNTEQVIARSIAKKKKTKKKKALKSIVVPEKETKQEEPSIEPEIVVPQELVSSTITSEPLATTEPTKVRSYGIAPSIIRWAANPQKAFTEYGYIYRNEQNFNYIVYIHTLPLALIDLAFEKGYVLHDERGTTALLAGELHIPGQKARIGVYSAGKNLTRNTVYHHCFSSKPSAYGLVEEFFTKSKWDIDYPPLMNDNTPYEQVAHVLSLMDDNNWTIKSEDRYFITFHNNVTGVEFVGYKTQY